MAKINWSKQISTIMSAEPPKGHAAYTYELIEKKTGIGVSTLCRLFTGAQKKLDYDKGVKLIALKNYLIETNRIK